MAHAKENEDKWTIALRDDQWELIVLAMRHVRTLTGSDHISYPVDRLGREFLRRRVNEIEAAIQNVVGDIEK